MIDIDVLRALVQDLRRSRSPGARAHLDEIVSRYGHLIDRGESS